MGVVAFGDKYSGGIYQYTQSIIDALKADGTKEYIIFCNVDDIRFDDYILEIRKIKKPKFIFFLKIFRLLYFLLNIRKSWFYTQNELKMFADIDVFVCPTISAYPHFFMNKPFVFTLHDMQERYYPEFFSKYENFSRWLNNIILARSSTKIICESTFVKTDIVRFIKVNESKVHVIQSPPPKMLLNYEFQEESFEFIKTKYDLPERFIFYPAQCWYHKNHIKLLEAFKIVTSEVSDVHLILTGSQQNNYDNLMNRVHELNLTKVVRHLGYVDYVDLPYIYKFSEFLVMPTLFESVSIPIYEAFALEVAVCCSNVVALPEQVGSAALVFNPHDINDMALKMMTFLNDKEFRKEKAKSGLRRIRGFNHIDYSSKLLKVIDELF